MLYKQVLLVRQDLKLPQGKLSAQCAHASVEAVLKTDKKTLTAWRNAGMLKVKDEKELLQYLQQARDVNLTTALITDAGKTVVAPGTKTCGAIGPDDEEEIDAITGKLPLL